MISYVRNLFKTTAEHAAYWRDRKVDWKVQYLDTWNHPHRQMLSFVLRTFDWFSIFEVGVGGAANIVQLIQTHGDKKQYGGSDINASAIDFCNGIIRNAFFKTCPATDLMMSDDSVDVVLSDMSLIYLDHKDIHKALEEMKRVARVRVVLCEFHSESLWERLKIKATSGYNVYNYSQLLEKHGFYDIVKYKIPKEAWPGGGLQEQVGYVIVAKVPRRK
jgi:ubiquinone/menaquinone biosynthesis C-methylase UbiE